MSSPEVDDAVGEAPARSAKVKDNEQSTLEQRAAELRRVVEQPTEAAAELAAVERQIAETREANAKEAAQARLLGIRRAYGSVTSSLDADEKRVRQKIDELGEAITRMNDRYSQVAQLRAEAMALSDRFALPTPALPNVIPPARRGLVTGPVGFLDHADNLRPVEECEHRLRTRRSYGEVRDTEGYGIIEAAGLKPFPPLTQVQQRIIDERAREQEDIRRQLANLPTIPPEMAFFGGVL